MLFVTVYNLPDGVLLVSYFHMLSLVLHIYKAVVSGRFLSHGWRRGVLVTVFDVSMKLLYIGPG